MAARKIDGKWYADFRFQHADGSVARVRKRSPVQSKAGADEFEHQLRTALLAPTHTTKEVPTFAAYADEFKKTYVLANNKPSERSMKASILKHHLLPVFGATPLDAIKMHAIEVLKAGLLAKGLSRKRVNNILACLGKMLRYAHEIELIEIVPRVKLLKVPQQRFDFLTFEELSRLVEAVKGDPERLALVLLGAEAGLRQGETMALEWGEVTLDELARAQKIHPVASVQSELSLWTRDHLPVVARCAAENIAFLAYSPLGRGFLTGRFTKLSDFEDGDWRRQNPRFRDEATLKANLALVETVGKVAKKHGRTPAQIALAWALAQGSTVIPIPGTRKLQRLEENVASSEVKLDAADLATLDALPAARGARY